MWYKKIKTVFLLVLTITSTAVLGAKTQVSTENELVAAIESVQPGDTIVMNDGIWKDLEIDFDGNGTESDPIVLMANTTGQVFLEGNSSLNMGGNYLVVNGLVFQNGSTPSGAVIELRSDNDCNNCRVTNSSIVAFNSGSDNQKWVSLYGRENRVDHCLFKGKTDGGTLLVVWLNENSHQVNHLIDYNQFLDRPDLGANGGEIMRIGDSNTSMLECGTVVEYNYFENCDGEIEIISNKSGNNIYRYNTFFNNAGQLTLRHGNNCRVEGNFFFGNNKSNSSGVRVIGEGHVVVNNYFQDLKGTGKYRSAISIIGGVKDSPLNRYFTVKDAVVAFNTLINCSSSISIGGDPTSSSEEYEDPENCTLVNNLIYNGSTNSLIEILNNPIDFENLNNFYEANSLGENISGWESKDLSLETVEVNGYSLQKLSSQSPAIDASSNAVTVSTDIDGQTRNNPDVGSDEFSTESVKIFPLNRELTGPSLTDVDFLFTSTSELRFLVQGSSETLNINSNIDWTATTNETWLSLDKTAGTNNETVEVTVDEYTKPFVRKGVITIQGGAFTREVEVLQEAAEIILEGEKLNVIKVTATAEQVDDTNSNGKELTLDGDLSTRWSAEGEQSITFELEHESFLSHIKVAFYKGDQRTTTFQIDGSQDNVTFSNLVAKGESSGFTSDFEYFEINDIKVKYIRITGFGNSTSDWNSISEVEFWGEIIEILGVEKTQERHMTVYPNPVQNTLFVQWESDHYNTKLEILDLTGRLVSGLNIQGNQASINTNSLRNGMYLLKVFNGLESRVRRFQVKK